MSIDNSIDELHAKLKDQPIDDGLMATIALYYIEHPQGDKDLEYLNKAYQTNPSIENSHNLEFWSYFEYGKIKKAIQLQKQVLSLNPKSYYPYASYAQMLIANSDSHEDGEHSYNNNASEYQAIVSALQSALEKSSHRHRIGSKKDDSAFILYNNMAYGYANLNDYQQALSCFKRSEQLIDELLQTGNSDYCDPVLNEHLYWVLLNKISLHIVLGDKQQAMALLVEARSNKESCSLEIADLYAKMGDYDIARNLVQTEDVHESWDWIWYAIYQSDKDEWHQMVNAKIEEHRAYLLKYQNKMQALYERPSSDDLSVDLIDCQEDIDYHQTELEKFESLLIKDEPPKPQDNTLRDLRTMFSGCLLFGCQRHNNLLNDDMR